LSGTERTTSWLAWARELQALSQTGLAFVKSEYDRELFDRLARIAAEMLAAHTDLEAPALHADFLGQLGYATPKIDVRAAALRDGRILLVQEAQDRRWAMPGGWADVGRGPAEMIVQEVVEESGFEVRPLKIVGVWDANRTGRALELYHAYKMVFLCEIVAGEARPSHETLAVDFFDFDGLPPLSRHRTNEFHLAEVRAHLADPARPTAFD
jgi:ADP-ribose pyrophosphatase YjhB (NUDIX family)